MHKALTLQQSTNTATPPRFNLKQQYITGLICKLDRTGINIIHTLLPPMKKKHHGTIIITNNLKHRSPQYGTLFNPQRTKLLGNYPAPNNRYETRHHIHHVPKLRILVNPYSNQWFHTHQKPTKRLVRSHTLPPFHKILVGHYAQIVTLREPEFLRGHKSVQTLATQTQIAHVSRRQEARNNGENIVRQKQQQVGIRMFGFHADPTK
ncbi:hypothetical protein V8G54_007140 [Vigna mungo]|uniref:Uncharacterized protein n=1 Tax=Vigna mungo TaxID=3915 RepID=A0AAQ3S807_VIGMU